MLFKGVWGFDPEEALRVQNRFRQSGVRNGSAEGIDCNSRNEAKIPETKDLQVRELERLFCL